MDYTDMEMKLWRLALNAGAMQGEWQTAAVKLVGMLRKRQVVPEVLTARATTPPPRQPRPDAIDWGKTVVNFGKHKGRCLRDIDPSYLVWLLGWISEDVSRRVRFASLSLAITKFMDVDEC